MTRVTGALEARNLVVQGGGKRFVDGVDLMVPESRAIGIAGESGSGKSLLAQALLGVLPEELECSADVLTWTEGESVVDLLALDAGARRRLLGSSFGLAWQEPASALNPVMSVGAQMEEALIAQGSDPGGVAREVAARFTSAGLDQPEMVVTRLPSELSGGQRQRVMVALALAGDPKLLVADEPTTALDATTRLRLLSTLRDERAERGLSLMVISHDLQVLAATCEDVYIMYDGRIVERGPVAEVLHAPRHPYAIGLVRAGDGRVGGRFLGIGGTVPEPGDRSSGCRFRGRCPYQRSACADGDPTLEDADSGHEVACPPALEGRVPPGVWPREGTA